MTFLPLAFLPPVTFQSLIAILSRVAFMPLDMYFDVRPRSIHITREGQPNTLLISLAYSCHYSKNILFIDHMTETHTASPAKLHRNMSFGHLAIIDFAGRAI